MNRQTETEGDPPKRTFFLAYSFFQHTQILPLENHSLTFLTAAQPAEFRFSLPDRFTDLFLKPREIGKLHLQSLLFSCRFASTPYILFDFPSCAHILPKVDVSLAAYGLSCESVGELHSYPSLEITAAVAAPKALTPIFPEALS